MDRCELMVGPSTFTTALATAWEAAGWRVTTVWSENVRAVVTPLGSPSSDELLAYARGARAVSHIEKPFPPPST